MKNPLNVFAHVVVAKDTLYAKSHIEHFDWLKITNHMAMAAAAAETATLNRPHTSHAELIEIVQIITQTNYVCCSLHSIASDIDKFWLA